MIFIPDGLNLSISGINNLKTGNRKQLAVKSEDPAGWPGLFGFAY
jgi:hypothetical protein